MATARVKVGGWSWAGADYVAGDSVEAPEHLIRRWVADGYVETGGTPAPATIAQPEQADAPAAEPATAWRHKMSPSNYLNRFPDGPDADLARALTEGE